MPRTPTARLGLAANAAALGCIVVAFLERDQGTVEGAYFNRSVGGAGGDTFVVSTANLAPWLMAAAALLVLGTAGLLAGCSRSSGVSR